MVETVKGFQRMLLVTVTHRHSLATRERTPMNTTRAKDVVWCDTNSHEVVHVDR